MDPKDIFDIVKGKFGDRVGEADLEGKEPSLPVKAEAIQEVCQFLRDEERLKFDYLNCLSGVDRKDHLAVAYHLESLQHKHAVALKVEDVDREDPKVPSVSGIWGGADWHEREAYDLVGIVFEGHPNLVRILCAEDWEGHPLRKDYQSPETYHGVPNQPEYMD
jgi:NADH-quinone oxidoreductase subunit C